ncbi:unnamed protein product [Vitrella brassicaformis CCMP3155]|uniref:Uncharacterized protein n=1 Tax=Vitrella brassicaformis (strain CCMP3155) TaxID=1169540 RepID=A0A0G4END6_VITBC|nr:unnamed protein product [Vitrella brassicaformis CCMP3155]|eukprot:CEL98845.1 unnamed protein product [Vitrella brassicaformis CCMP3155]
MSSLVVVVVALSAILRGHAHRVRDPAFLASFLHPPPDSTAISLSSTAKTALRGTPQTSSNARSLADPISVPADRGRDDPQPHEAEPLVRGWKRPAPNRILLSKEHIERINEAFREPEKFSGGLVSLKANLYGEFVWRLLSQLEFRTEGRVRTKGNITYKLCEYGLRDPNKDGFSMKISECDDFLCRAGARRCCLSS